MPSSLGTVAVPCPACGRTVTTTANLGEATTSDARCVAAIEVDTEPIRAHIRDFHCGPDGDGGEPLPLPKAA